VGEKERYPRFKPLTRYDSFTYPQSGGAMSDHTVRLSKIGDVKIKLHRPITGTIKTCTVTVKNGRDYVSFSYEVEEQAMPVTQAVVGID
jgi:putative transposase